MSEQEIRAKLRGWIAKHARKTLGADFSDADPLLESGILSSLDIVEFVLFIESLRGEEIEPDSLEAEVFANIDALYLAFFARS